MMNLLEEAKFIISRYDHYFDSINSKSNIYLALNTFIIGGIISGYYALDKQYHFGYSFKYLFLVILLVNLGAIFFTLSAIRPFLCKRRNLPEKSLYYFGDVATFNVSHYRKTLKNITEQDLLNDATNQIHQLATGLNKKYKRINLASILIGVQVFLIMVFVVLLTLKY